VRKLRQREKEKFPRPLKLSRDAKMFMIKGRPFIEGKVKK
jgi:hypothetical protein